MRLSRSQQLELVSATLKGSHDAFATLHETYDSRLRRYLGSYVRNDADRLDDLMQAAWMQIFRKLHQFKGTADFTTWAYRIGANRALMNKRMPDEKHAWAVTSLDEPNLLDEGQSFQRHVTYRDKGFDWAGDRERLYKAISQLPLYSRGVFKLRLQGFLFSEIAEIQGLSIGTVKSYHHRGLKMLATRMGVQ